MQSTRESTKMCKLSTLLWSSQIIKNETSNCGTDINKWFAMLVNYEQNKERGRKCWSRLSVNSIWHINDTALSKYQNQMKNEHSEPNVRLVEYGHEMWYGHVQSMGKGAVIRERESN